MPATDTHHVAMALICHLEVDVAYLEDLNRKIFENQHP